MTKSLKVTYSVDLAANQGIDIEAKLSAILREEIEKEMMFELIDQAEKLDLVKGLYGFWLKMHDPRVKNLAAMRMWLEENLSGRFEVIHQKYFTKFDFGKDGEAATLFKMFWLQ